MIRKTNQITTAGARQGVGADACAAEILDVIPAVMRFIRTDMRSRRAPGLNVPQFRTLMYVHRNQERSLTDVAEHLGLTPASTSTLVDGLARRGLLRREAAASDRRRISLSLSETGHAAMESVRRETRATLAAALSALAAPELRVIAEAMSALRRPFAASARALDVKGKNG
jgi:DNA-binding MarR family transcriptional regulator